jgi:IS5 family transposase
MQRTNAAPTFTDLTLANLGGPRATAFFETCQREIPLAAWPSRWLTSSTTTIPRAALRTGRWSRCSKSCSCKSVLGSPTQWPRRCCRTGSAFASLWASAWTTRRRTTADGSGSVDPCASKTVKGGRSYHGYRVHIASDRRGIITDYVFDTASVSEHEHFDHLARNETKAVFADSGCRSKDRVARLRRCGVTAGFCHGRVKGQKELRPQQKRLNRLIAPIRAFVEHPLGWIKLRLNNRRVRYRGLAHNAMDFALSAMACNFCRSFTLTRGAQAG